MAVKKGVNWLLIGVITLGFVLIVSMLSASDQPDLVKHRNSNKLELPQRADHDTNENTIKTFTASNQELMNQTQGALVALEAAENRLEEKANRLSDESHQYDSIVKQNKQQEQTITELEQKINNMNLEWTQKQTTENLADFGIHTKPLKTHSLTPDTLLEGEGTWISSDQLATAISPEENTGLKKFKAAGNSRNSNNSDTSRHLQTQSNNPSTNSSTRPKPNTEVTPLYTIPYDAILYDAKSLTALLGRIPISGKTQDPFPAKMIIGRDNLLASGFDLPEIHAMIVSGEAFGDWNLSCVRVNITAATFIYQDGSITTHQSKGGDAKIGYISDRQGVPCISGQFVSNAAKYIGGSVGLAALGAVGEAYSEAAQTKIISPSNGTITKFTDQIDHLVAGSAVDSAASEIITWIKDRQQNSFDAVVVPPGAAVSIHIQQEIAINTSPQQRRVRYATSAAAQSHLLE